VGNIRPLGQEKYFNEIIVVWRQSGQGEKKGWLIARGGLSDGKTKMEACLARDRPRGQDLDYEEKKKIQAGQLESGYKINATKTTTKEIKGEVDDDKIRIQKMGPGYRKVRTLLNIKAKGS